MLTQIGVWVTTKINILYPDANLTSIKYRCILHNLCLNWFYLICQ